jgi:hypothetical protein
VRTIIAAALGLSLLVPSIGAQSVANGDVWRTFAQQLVVGSRIKVRLTDGERVTATLVQAGSDALLLQPITRVPVPVQRVDYDQVVSIERDEGRGGVSAAKAAAIGVASGVGAFFGVMLIFLAAAAD